MQRARTVGDGAVGNDQQICRRSRDVVGAASCGIGQVKRPRGAAGHGFVGGARHLQTTDRLATSQNRHRLAAVGGVAAAVHDIPRLGDADLRANPVRNQPGRGDQNVGEHTRRRYKLVGTAGRNNRRVKCPVRAALDGLAVLADHLQAIATAIYRHRLAAIGRISAPIRDGPGLGDQLLRAGTVGVQAGGGNERVGQNPRRSYNAAGATSRHVGRIEVPSRATGYSLVGGADYVEAWLTETRHGSKECHKNVTMQPTDNCPHIVFLLNDFWF